KYLNPERLEEIKADITAGCEWMLAHPRRGKLAVKFFGRLLRWHDVRTGPTLQLQNTRGDRKCCALSAMFESMSNEQRQLEALSTLAVSKGWPIDAGNYIHIDAAAELWFGLTSEQINAFIAGWDRGVRNPESMDWFDLRTLGHELASKYVKED